MAYIVALGGALACATTATGQEEARPVPPLPSGVTASLLDWLVDEPAGLGLTARFRFVVPAIAQGTGFAEVEDDFPVLCHDYALPALAQGDVAPDRVIISYAGAPIEFGASDPEIVQFFEVFRIENGICIWEGF